MPRLGGAALAAGLLLAGCAPPPEPTLDVVGLSTAPYDYPLSDPFAATVIGTPRAFRAPLPERMPVDELTLRVFPGRKVPGLFWYDDRLRYSLAAQKGIAPLIFVVGGAGASHRSRRVALLQRIFYGAGFHVIALPSPTHPNFAVAASETGVPGRAAEDARDLYRVMRLAWRQVGTRIAVSRVYLAGFGFGAWQAAFVAKLDERARALRFAKVLLINPPVDPYKSARRLDRLLPANLPRAMADAGPFFDRAFAAFARAYRERAFVAFDGDYLYRAYNAAPPDGSKMAALVGLSFRLAAADLIFTADVMTGGGYVVPRGVPPGVTSSLARYARAGFGVGFGGYLDGLVYPYYRARAPALTRRALAAEASLASIERYLAGARKIGLVTNADDFVLAPGDLDFLRRLFGDRARIFPTGGHGGNLAQRRVVGDIVGFFAR